MAKSATIKPKPSTNSAALQGLAAGALLMGAPSMATLLAILLAPGLLCLLADRAPGRPMARASLLAGLAFSVAPAWHLWQAGLGFDHAFAQLQDISIPAAAWCACTAGWLASELVPLGIRLIIEAQTERRRRKLVELRDELVKEWNLKIGS